VCEVCEKLCELGRIEQKGPKNKQKSKCQFQFTEEQDVSKLLTGDCTFNFALIMSQQEKLRFNVA
jgi:hypothetical protein